MTRSMAFLSINLLISVIRERCDTTGIHSQLHKCVKSTSISPITEQSSPHSCFLHYREGITMWSSVVESYGLDRLYAPPRWCGPPRPPRPPSYRGGSRAIPDCSAHQVYYQSADSVGPVCDHLLTRAQGHSAVELPLITSFFGHSGAVVHGELSVTGLGPSTFTI